MKRAARNQRREQSEEAKQRRIHEAAVARQTREKSAEVFKNILTKSGASVKSLVQYYVDGSAHQLEQALSLQLSGRWPFTPRGDVLPLPPTPQTRFKRLLSTVADEAPKLVTKDYFRPLQNLARFDWVRPLSSWKPEGKSRETLYRSLAEHLICRYPTPKFLWSAFFDSVHDKELAPLVDHIAKGGSLYDMVKKGELSVPLTRKMCHEFMSTTSEYNFLSGIRRIQIRTYGGSPRLFTTWLNTAVGRSLKEAPDEEFWATVLQFFTKNPMIDHDQVGPLVDYIAYRRREDKSFTMKSRSVAALMRGMEEWHGHLAKAKTIKKSVFERSGFKNGEYRTDSTEGVLIWRIQEILTSKDLLEEGRDLRHCVASYSHTISPAQNSIWSMTWQHAGARHETPKRIVTIQVANQRRQVLQYRGWCNAVPPTREFQIIQKWAGSNSLSFGQNGW